MGFLHAKITSDVASILKIKNNLQNVYPPFFCAYPKIIFFRPYNRMEQFLLKRKRKENSQAWWSYLLGLLPESVLCDNHTFFQNFLEHKYSNFH